MGWGDILAHPGLMITSLHQVFGIDWDDPALAGRRWPWWRERIVGLLAEPCALSRALLGP